jgi:hypothetical protein
MTKKDYIAIAGILAAQFAVATPAEKGPIWALTLSMADYFATEGARFDRSKFYTAVLGSPDHFQVRDDFMRELGKVRVRPLSDPEHYYRELPSDARRSEVI